MLRTDLLPCPCCGKSDLEQWPCEWLDGSGDNVVRCAWCHCAAPMNTWNRRAAPPAQAVSVPEGFALVPKVPTREMLDAAGAAQDRGDWIGAHYFERAWPHMLAAAPAAATREGKCEVCEGMGMANVVDPYDGALVIGDCPNCPGDGSP